MPRFWHPGPLCSDRFNAPSLIKVSPVSFSKLRPGAPPLSARLLREVHARLLRSGRGARKAPGEFRRTQNWLGGSRPGLARFVPPPAPEVPPLELTSPPVYAAIDRLEQAGILREATGRRRGKLYVYDKYFAILGEGTEPEE